MQRAIHGLTFKTWHTWKMRCYRSGNAYLLKYDKSFSIQFRGIYAVYGPEFVRGRHRAMLQKLVFSRFSHISAAA